MSVSALTIAIYALAAMMFITAVALARASRRRAQEERTRTRFEQVAFAGGFGAQPGQLSLAPTFAWIANPLLRAGIEPRPWHPWAGLAVLLGSALLGFLAGAGIAGALAPPTLIAGVAYVYLLWRGGRLRARMLGQLPGFIDAVLRAVAAGRNLENAINAAKDHTPPPLRGVFERVMRRVQLGGDLGEGLDEARRVYQLRELAFLRLVVMIGQRYGGSVKEPLGNVAALIRQYEQNQREVRAMTGEVRLSAWLLGILPVAVGAYVLAVNPNYLEVMLADPAGRTALILAATMQVLGALILWRMVKTVL